MTEYKKPFLTIEEQISLFEERGLEIPDKDRARFFLRNISYYHLSIYTKAFQSKDNIFVEGTSFEDVLDLYNFDKKLRLLLLDILERIEMSFKCTLAYDISKDKNDNFWYASGDSFRNNDEDIEKLLGDIKTSNEIYIKKYYENYGSPDYPPAWIFFESLTFGECVRLARNLYDRDRQTISGFYRLPKKTAIQMFHCLSHLRNICAHHSWLWNRWFTMKISKYKKYDDIFGDSPEQSLYSYIVAIQILLKKISPTSKWLEKLEELIKEYNVTVYRMGFPEDWIDKLKSIK